MYGLLLIIYCLLFKFHDFWFLVSGLRFRVQGLGFGSYCLRTERDNVRGRGRKRGRARETEREQAREGERERGREREKGGG